MKMGRIFGAVAGLFLAGTAHAAPAPVSIWRLDCGKIVATDLDVFSDTHAYIGQRFEFTVSCYLIRHGDDYMLWDTGLPRAQLNHVLDPKINLEGTMSVTIVDQLARLGIDPGRIGIVGISHHHFDHTGQTADFPQARLLIGKGDVDDLRAHVDDRSRPIAHWLNEGGRLEPVTGDKDVFGDGSVVMIDLPGHTPGHHALLLKLEHKGYVLLSGDLTHFATNYAKGGIPTFNSNRADSLASLARFREMAANLKATVIIQHEPGDIAKLPAFPKAAD